jgi:ABC-type glycerol-3-phosphate transport system permease component
MSRAFDGSTTRAAGRLAGQLVRRSLSERVSRIPLYICAVLIVGWSVGPFVWQLSTSLQLDRDLISDTPKFLPDPISFQHFLNIFVEKSFHRYLFNSLVGYFETIPATIDEVARIDGARSLTIFFRFIAPISLPGIVTTGLLCFIAAWNEFMFALAFTSDLDRPTVPVEIANFTDLHYVPWGDIAAASVVVTLPLVIVGLVFQQHVISGLTGGAIKE